jgi:hypothetical protein
MGARRLPAAAPPSAPALEDPAFSQYPRGQRLMGYSMRTVRYRLTVWLD